jgi:tetratricopeptide (TPR) repeat protein
MDRIEKLKEFLRQDPNDNFSRHALGLEFVKRGEELLARELFEEILQRDPGYVGTYYHLGKLLERAGDEHAAIRVYSKGIEEAKRIDDIHALNELRSALEELSF